MTTLQVTIEIPKDTRNKYEMDHGTGRIHLNRVLYTAMGYPTDYGFIEGWQDRAAAERLTEDAYRLTYTCHWHTEHTRRRRLMDRSARLVPRLVVPQHPQHDLKRYRRQSKCKTKNDL